MKRLSLLLVSLFATTLVWGRQAMTPAPLNVRSVNGNVSNYPYQLKFPNGDLTDNADGTMTVADSTVALSASAIVITSSIQPGATFYVSSGTVGGFFQATGTVLLGGTANSVTISTNIIFSPTTAGIQGTPTNDNADAGKVGESQRQQISATNIAPSTHWVVLSTITLTAGDWDLTGTAVLSFGGTTGNTENEMCTTTTSGDNATGCVTADNYVFQPAGIAGVSNVTCNISAFRVSINTSTPYYLKVESTYSTGTPTAAVRLSARRIR